MMKGGRGLVPMLMAIAMGLVACQEEPSTTVAGEGLQELAADNVVYGLEEILTQDGVRSGIVRADSAYVFGDSALSHLYEVDMTLYNDQGRDRAHLTADRGVLHQRSELMTAEGNVVLRVLDQGVTVETSRLRYDPSSQMISSDTVSTFRRDGKVQHGTCFRSDLQFTSYSVCQPVGAIFEPGEQGNGAGGAPR